MIKLLNKNTKYELPDPLDFGWEMKSLTSAETSFIIDEQGVFKLNIIHDLIKDVTPTMLLWWFKNIAGNMEYKGNIYRKYSVWHPKDHIHWELVCPGKYEKVGVGAKFKIVEAFGRDKKNLINSIEIVEKLDETGIRLVKRIFGIEIFSLQHDFQSIGNNTLYKSEMIVGTHKFPMNIIFNLYIKPQLFTEEMGNAWLKHNIEEVGNFEYFLPDLYEKEMK
jgi:hypothetical protein